jgi:hypothetical protein
MSSGDLLGDRASPLLMGDSPWPNGLIGDFLIWRLSHGQRGESTLEENTLPGSPGTVAYLVLKVKAIRVDHLSVGRTGVDATSKDPSRLVQGHRLVGCTMFLPWSVKPMWLSIKT